MSQPSTPFNGLPADPFLPAINHESETFSHAQLEQLFGPNPSDHPVFTSTTSELLDDLDFTFDEPSLSHGTSTAASTISTPDFSSHAFEPSTTGYPHPQAIVNPPLPYPLDHLIQPHTLTHRPLPARAHTNSSSPFLSPSLPSPSASRRRSLSHGDADRISNPTFIRLQVPRARSVTPEDKRRGPYARHGRSVSTGPGYGARGRSGKATWHGAGNGGMRVGGMIPRRIGRPLDAEAPDEHWAGRMQAYAGMGQHGSAEVVVRHMTDARQLERSRRIIEIGAVAVRPQGLGTLDPRLEDEGLGARERAVRKLEDVERYLKLDGVGSEDALRGCEVIREALAKQSGQESDMVELADGNEGRGEDTLELPSKAMGKDDGGLFGGCLDENDLMSLLMRENERYEAGDA